MLRASTRLAWAAFHVCCALALGGTARAQGLCEEDAGLCDEDGGSMQPADAGAAPDAGGDAGAPGVGTACSCHTDQDDDGRIHLCTDGVEADVCESFSCELGRLRSSRCPTRGVELCCNMESRGLQSRLYDDCTHANCESGFREQCRAFGGEVYDGDCPRESEGGEGGSGEEDEDVGGLCSVGAPGRTRRAAGAWLGLGLLAAAALGVRRRDRLASITRR